MKNDYGLTELIFEYYESHILFGFYRYGEQLSSVSKISSSFQLGRNTVRAALAKLEDKGYIVTEERKVARVVYQGTEADFEEYAARYFVPRREGILDFSRAGKLLILPLWEAGLHNLDRKALLAVGTGQGSVISDARPMPINLYVDVLRTLDNNLLLTFYWQCLRYVSFLYPSKKISDTKADGEVLLQENQLESLSLRFERLYGCAEEKILDFIQRAEKKYHLEDVPQIPFQWIIYRQRPQVRYTLASRVIREILGGRYPAGSFLPSLPKMAEEYQVSQSTVRRTLAVLESLGVTRSYMGVGTKVCMEPVDFDRNASDIRESLRLHGEGLQMLALTVQGVMLFTLETATHEKRRGLLEELSLLKGKTGSILFIDLFLSFIVKECPSGIVRECYDKLRDLVTWGYILSVVTIENKEMNIDLSSLVTQLEKDLRAGDLPGFADRVQSFIENRLDFFTLKYSPHNCESDRIS